MSDEHEPSLLEYARFHGIASDFTSIRPSEYLDQINEVPLENPTLPEDRHKAFDEYLFNTQQSLEKTIREEKLNVKKDGVRFLSTVIRDVKTQTFESNSEQQTKAFRRINQLRLEPPIFNLEHETSLASLRPQSSYNTEDVELLPVEEPLEFRPETIVKTAEEIKASNRRQKVNCSKQSLVLLQDVIRLGNPSLEYLDGLLATIPRKIHPTRIDPDDLVPMGTDDAVYRSPSPQREFQMLPSPASIELSASIEQRPSRPESSDAGLTTRIYGCTRSTPKFELGHVAQTNQDNSTSEIWNKLNCQGAGKTNDEDICISSSLPHDGSPCTCLEEASPGESSHLEQRLSEGINEHLPRTIESTSLDSTVRGFADEAAAEADTPAINPLSTNHQSHTIACDSLHGDEVDLKDVECPAGLDPYGCSSWCLNKDTSEDISMIEMVTEQYNQNTSEQTISQMQPSAQTREGENGRVKAVDSATASVNNTLCFAGKFSIADEQPLPQKKRKLWDPARNEARNSMNRSQTSRPGTQQQQPAPPSSISLGSLAAFMELRGRSGKRLVPTQSPYFAVEKSIETGSSPSHQTKIGAIPRLQPDESDTVDKSPVEPQFEKPMGERHTLFLSTALLKSHLRLVRCLEGMIDPPGIIYRDYNQNGPSNLPQSKHITSSMSNNVTPQDEADIIISPSTGIILTTSQATTQLYLPGHKFSHPQLTGIGFINSPLRERIFLLAPRYERIYIFICQNTSSSRKSQAKQPGPTADKRVLASIASLTAFCNSLSAYATICPLLLSSTPETVAGWVLSLATKHMARLPVSTVGLANFTPINASQKSKLSPEDMERTTVWELFLRQAGLNPYAAQAVLAGMRREDEQEIHYQLCTDDGRNAWDSVEKGHGKGLSRFIEMSPAQRSEIFGELIGGRLLGRVNNILDKDWQCDCALNFDVNTEI
ncbi:uncharacterized protein ACLA_084440 [Aspergillus clavatus NRRL 1]|uniref:Uncharacterized protein n=1 Tax=Aspergillus clavatus (strain ATCC 1007 / CBS 513.65 / DSM 816 / NCTC 3887 / NRRL 1 / QM 1276 / 107) TaxID=344612 RepID=A1CTW2_ASPCL|nr:uncharacterized protein ACLA_084440 [Aspergillus clavatus NRRL 1]EAW06749.1 hypothetical protein ACLA_084440 [Aspergillus clavatus NRRL 1]